MNDDELFEQVVHDLTTPLDWRVVPVGEAKARWDDLRTWVRWLAGRYALDHRVAPPCWYLHGALVDLLSALRDHHRASFEFATSPTDAAKWHGTFQSLEPRLREWASRTGCTRDEHRPDVQIQWPADDERWAAHLAADREHLQARQASQAAETPAR